jgi:hypothetical protein
VVLQCAALWNFTAGFAFLLAMIQLLRQIDELSWHFSAAWVRVLSLRDLA